MPVEVIRAQQAGARVEDLERAARVLREGGLVAFPTETVYGLAVRADDQAAVARLAQVKRRPDGKEFTYHLAHPEDVERFVPDLPRRVHPLIRKFWPGPLTIVVPSPNGGTIGFRVPAHPVARDLIASAGCAVIASSANRSGEKPAVDAEQVLATFGDEVDVVVDGGPTPLAESSTVVRVDRDGFEVLRDGIISAATIRRLLSTTVLFVCTGNSCRSPMAELLLKAKLARRLKVPQEDLERLGFRVVSAGTSAVPGLSASPCAVEVMMEDYGLDLRRHRTRPLNEDVVEDATYIYAMSASHAQVLADLFPEARGRVRLLSAGGIVDPIGGPIELYRECATRIDRDLDAVADLVLGGAAAPASS